MINIRICSWENFNERKSELDKNEFNQAQNVIKRIFETVKRD